MLAALTPGQVQVDEIPGSLDPNDWSIQRLPEGGRAFDTGRDLAGTRSPGVSNTHVIIPRINALKPRSNGDEAIELWAPAATPLDDLFVVACSTTGVVVKRWDLDGNGRLVLTLVWPAGLSGLTTTFQYWTLDPAGPNGPSASNGLSGATP